MKEILLAILAELRYMNAHNRDLENRIKALEEKDVLYTPCEAKDYLGISYNTLRARRDRGYLHEVIRGGRRGYMLSELKRVKNQ